MIRNDSELQEALRRLEGGEKGLAEYRAKLEGEGLTPEQIEYAVGPSASSALQVREEVAQYERIKRGDLEAIVNLHGLGPMLIAARIAAGVPQRQLAERLGVHESLISRDERNEYHGVTVERASRILDALGVKLTTSFEREAATTEPARRTAWAHAMQNMDETSAPPADAAPERTRSAPKRSVIQKGKKKPRRPRVNR